MGLVAAWYVGSSQTKDGKQFPLHCKADSQPLDHQETWIPFSFVLQILGLWLHELHINICIYDLNCQSVNFKHINTVFLLLKRSFSLFIFGCTGSLLLLTVFLKVNKGLL